MSDLPPPAVSRVAVCASLSNLVVSSADLPAVRELLLKLNRAKIRRRFRVVLIANGESGNSGVQIEGEVQTGG